MNAESELPSIPSLKGVKLTPEFIKKLEDRIDRDGPVPSHCPEIGNCHLWTGGFVAGTHHGKPAKRIGYGRICHPEGKDLLVHRVSYELYVGAIPPGMYVLHRCDDTRCCRKEHLFLGTHDENMADMVAKKRAASGDDNISRKRPELLPHGDYHWTRRTPGIQKGEGNGRAILLESDVREIRGLHASGISKSAIARMYGLNKSQPGRIISGRQWGHIV